MQIDKRKPLGIAIFAILAASIFAAVSLFRNSIILTIKYLNYANTIVMCLFLLFIATRPVDRIVVNRRY